MTRPWGLTPVAEASGPEVGLTVGIGIAIGFLLASPLPVFAGDDPHHTYDGVFGTGKWWWDHTFGGKPWW